MFRRTRIDPSSPVPQYLGPLIPSELRFGPSITTASKAAMGQYPATMVVTESEEATESDIAPRLQASDENAACLLGSFTMVSR